MFCGRCGTMECIGRRYRVKCGAQLPRPKQTAKNKLFEKEQPHA